MIFDYKDNKVVIPPSSLTVPEFSEIWERDKAKNKSTALNELTYVWHMVDYKSPYATYDQVKKEELIALDVFKKDYKADALVKAAISKYEILQYTPESRLLKAWEKKIDEVANYLTGTPLTDDNLTQVLKAGVDIEKIISSVQKLRELVKKQQSESSHVRGSKNLDMFSE